MNSAVINFWFGVREKAYIGKANALNQIKKSD